MDFSAFAFTGPAKRRLPPGGPVAKRTVAAVAPVAAAVACAAPAAAAACAAPAAAAVACAAPKFAAAIVPPSPVRRYSGAIASASTIVRYFSKGGTILADSVACMYSTKSSVAASVASPLR